MNGASGAPRAWPSNLLTPISIAALSKEIVVSWSRRAATRTRSEICHQRLAMASHGPGLMRMPSAGIPEAYTLLEVSASTKEFPALARKANATSAARHHLAPPQDAVNDPQHMEIHVSVGSSGPMPSLTAPDGRGLPVSADEALPDTSRFTALADDYAARIMVRPLGNCWGLVRSLRSLRAGQRLSPARVRFPRVPLRRVSAGNGGRVTGVPAQRDAPASSLMNCLLL